MSRILDPRILSFRSSDSGGSPTKLIENGSLISKPADLARIMNEYFVNKLRNLRGNLPSNTGDPLALFRRLMMNRKCSLKLESVHPDQVLKIITNLKSSSFCRLDSIDSKIIKLVNTNLSQLSSTLSTYQ